jgi:MFS family permease
MGRLVLSVMPLGYDHGGIMNAGPLGHAAFRWLVAARTTSILGNAVAPFALAFAVLDLTGSATDLGIVVAARSITNVAMLLFGGVIADRLPRNVVLVGTSIGAGLTQAVVAALVISGSATIPLLVILSALNGAAAAISMPASSALVPQTVAADQLRPANSILRLGLNGGAIIGAAVGSILVAAFGPGIGLAIDAGAFLIAALLFSRLRIPAATAVVAEKSSVIRDLATGWREFTRRRWVWTVVLQFMIVNAALTGGIAVLGPIVADSSFGRAGWGLVLASETIGFVAGGLLALRWRPRHALLIGVLLTAVCAVPVLILATLPIVPVLMVAFFVGGIALEQFGIAWDQSLQQNIPADRLSRVYSYDAAGSYIAIPVGEILVGPLAQALGVEPVLFGCAALVVLASVLVAATRSVRGVTSDQSVPISIPSA